MFEFFCITVKSVSPIMSAVESVVVVRASSPLSSLLVLERRVIRE
jgi:hypothetical protein